jgi:putative oxidoreductase
MVRPVVLWVATILFGLMFLFAGTMKFLLPDIPEKFAAFGYPPGFHYVVGALEILGGLLLFVPRAAFYGAVVLAVIMAGAVYTHVVPDQNPTAALFPLTFLVGLVVLALARRPRAGGTVS